MHGRRSVYILPNLFTTASLFCGFYAILAANDGRFQLAAILIFVSMVFDGCDGRVARLTNTTSEFGVQYDSLADLISFGVAPALVLYQWSLHLIAATPLLPSKLGWMAAFLYAVCAALRLARFNTQVMKVDKKFFIGLPSPAAAAVIAGFVWVGGRYHWPPREVTMIATLLLILCGLAMVSNIRYFSGKSLHIEGRIPFRLAVVPAVILALIFLEPAPVLFILFLLYSLHGPAWILWRIYRRRHPKA